MTLKRSRSSRTSAIGSASSGPVAGQGVGDAVGQELAVRQPGRRVVQRPALGGLEEAGVVERDRGELGRSGSGRRSRAGPSARSLCPDAEAEDADDAAAGGQRHADDGAEDAVRQVGRAVGPGVVVVDGERPAVADDRAADPLVDRHAAAEEAVEEPDAVAHDERCRRPARAR